MIYGVDLHPTFQAGISIPQVKSEGFDFIICKLSQGTVSGSYEGSFPWIASAKSLGMAALGYHYLSTADPVAQARVFTNQLARAGVAGAVDVEKDSGNIENVHAFLQECSRLGARVSLLYMPQWYWKQIGSPSLAGLPPLWSSRYPDMVAGTAAQNYTRVPKSFWDGYGGNQVAVLQFSSTARVAGHTVDVNAFQGTPGEFSQLIVPGSPNNDAAQLAKGFLMALTDAEQAELLTTVRWLWGQLFLGDQQPGSKTPGWPMFPGGTAERLTVVDMLRRNNVEVESIKNLLSAGTQAAQEVAPGLDEGTLQHIVEQALVNVLSQVKPSAAATAS